MKKISFISAFRDIKSNFSRFISIFAIVALGVGFFAGVRAAKPDMTESADKYYDSQKLMDFSIMSVDGFTDDDINMVKEQVGSTVVESYVFDSVSSINDSDCVIKYYSLNNKINIPEIVEGRLPSASDECIVDANSIGMPVKVGDVIKVKKDQGSFLINTELKVVGLVNTALYISGTQYGTTNLGDGQIDTVAFLNEDAFNGEYNTLLVRCDFLRKYNCYSNEYKDGLKSVVDRLDSIMSNRLKAIIDGSYDYRRLDLQKHNPDLVASVNQIYTTKEQLETEYAALVTTKDYLDRTGELIDQRSIGYQQTLQETEAYISAEVAKYDAIKEEVSKLSQECEKAQNDYESTKLSIEQKSADLKTKRYTLSTIDDTTSAEYITLKTAIDTLQKELDILNDSIGQKEELYKQKADAMNKAFEEYDASYSSADKIFKELNNTNKISSDELVQMTISYRAAQIDYNTRLATYDAARVELNAGLDKIVSTVSQIYSNFDSLWYFTDRFDFPGNEEYGDNADRIGNIAIVFPAFFLLVAMLVCLTTMTRLVSEHRMQIGTLKALGYSNLSIALRYISYAMLATVAGCIVGLCVGFVLFPRVILYAYSMLYSINCIYTPFRVDIAIVSSLLMCVCIIFSVVCACYSEFTNSPSKLMRPKPMPVGKSILIDKIGFIWNKMSFTKKVMARNMFINKKRKLMTIVGVAGCTALLLTGFGLRDSITDINEKQFNEIWKYDLTAVYTDAKSAEAVIEDSDIDSWLMCYQKSHNISFDDNKQEAYVVIPKDSAKLYSFITLDSRTTSKRYSFDKYDCLITEKLSKLLDVKKGEDIAVEIDGEKYNVIVDGIVENYAEHYVYLSKDKFKSLTDQDAKYNVAYCKYDGKNIDKVAESLLESGKIQGVKLNADTKSSFDDILQLMNIVILILIISAAALSFVVVFNLTDINITERRREIATLKVLGFNKKEMYTYVFRENTVLSLIGTAVGLGLGYLLAMYVINTAEIDIVMFGRTIYPLSFVLSAVLSLLFTFIINIVMRPKANKVDMIESLKSVE